MGIAPKPKEKDYISSETTATLNQTNGAETNLIDLQTAGYNSQYTQPKVDAYNQYANRDPFSYDFNSDPVYQGLRDRYMMKGNMANYNTQAQAATNTSGYGNSYAQTAGYQAYSQSMDELMNQIPELAQQNLNRYNQEGQDMLDKYNMLADLEQFDYQQYRDTIADAYNDLLYFQSKYQYLNDQDFEHYKNSLSEWMENRDYNYKMAVLGDKAKELGLTSGHNEWVQDGDGSWYYFDEVGNPLTGWQKVDGKWYYMDQRFGDMKTGWQEINGKWYHMDGSGAMQTGWQKIGNTWYKMDDSGAMQTGWVKDNGKWYYLDQSGAMKTGWVKDKGKWYYTDGSGAMKTGWLTVGDKQYYLDSSGAMKENGTFTIDGHKYTFDKNGEVQLERREKTEAATRDQVTGKRI